MAYTPTFADATMLRTQIGDLGTRLTDAQILEILAMAEGRVRTILMLADDWTFDEDKPKHLLLRETVMDWAVLKILAATPLSAKTLDMLNNAEDVHWNSYIHNLAILNDDKQGTGIRTDQ